MKMIVVDDRQLAVNSLLKVLAAIDPSGERTGLLSAAAALEYLQKHRADVVFLDIEMPEMNGLELAKRLKDIQPKINIVFVTGHGEYALAAHGLYVAGFLLKPATEEKVLEALRNLRYPVRQPQNRLYVQCFGNFEVFVDGRPLTFKRSKTKELFAYLIDRKGAYCTMGELLAVLWEDRPDNASRKNQLRNLIADLRQSLRDAGLEDAVIKRWNNLAVDRAKVDCDYYGFLRSEPASVNAYEGEYMAQYSWAEMTTGFLSLQEK